MESLRKKINEYYSELISEIDINTELTILKCVQANLNKDKIDEINSDRENFLKQIQRCESENLKNPNDLFQGLFCHYFKPDNLNQPFSIGKLVIVKSPLPEKVIQSKREQKKQFLDFSESILIQVVRPFLFESELKIIDLTQEENKLGEIKVDYSYFRLDKYPLEIIENFINLKNLKKLRLEFGKCDAIEKCLFTDVNTIEELTIDCCTLHYIQENNFSCLKFLKKLKIMANCEIEQNAFYGLESLENLDLSGNYLVLESALQLNGLDCLKILQLSDNEISSLSIKPFYYLNSLKVLDLSNNYIESIEQGDLDGLDSIEELYLINYPSNGRFQSIEIKKNSLKNTLKVLNLLSGRIKLSGKCLENLKDLRYLNIKGIRDQELSTFRLPISLEFLEVTPKRDIFTDYNKIELPNLKYLSFGCISLSKFSFPNLQALVINDLMEIENGAFENQNKLDYLKLFFVDDLIINELNQKIFDGLGDRFRFFQINFYRPLASSVVKLTEEKDFFKFLFKESSDDLKIEVKYNEDILSLTAKNVESEDYYFSNVLDVSEQIKNAYEKSNYQDYIFHDSHL